MKQVWLADGVQTPWAEEADSFEVAKISWSLMAVQ